jgi:hypothetical protein
MKAKVRFSNRPLSVPDTFRSIKSETYASLKVSFNRPS